MDGRVGRKPIFPAADAVSPRIMFEKNAVLLADTVLSLPDALLPGLRNSINLFFYNNLLSFQMILL